MTAINSFDGPYAFLSNFYPARTEYDGLVFPTSEHAYQAAKTTNPRYREAFTESIIPPAVAKRMAKVLERRDDWDAVKLAVMTNVVAAKFKDPGLAEMLVATGDAEIIEGNTWGDVFWGVCAGKGRNELGKILMSLRRDLSNSGLFVI